MKDSLLDNESDAVCKVVETYFLCANPTEVTDELLENILGASMDEIEAVTEMINNKGDEWVLDLFDRFREDSSQLTAQENLCFRSFCLYNWANHAEAPAWLEEEDEIVAMITGLSVDDVRAAILRAAEIGAIEQADRSHLN